MRPFRPLADALGAHPLPYGLVVRLPGLAYRAPKGVIREHIMSCSALHDLSMNYSQRVMHQLAQSGLCNHFHTSVQRLARWLLLTAEKAETNRFELTHEFVAQMVGATLGGQRIGVRAAGTRFVNFSDAAECVAKSNAQAQLSGMARHARIAV